MYDIITVVPAKAKDPVAYGERRWVPA